jgi:hypothetical protein
VPGVAVFCSSLISCFLHVSVRYFVNDFKMVPLAPIIPGISFVFICRIYSGRIVRSLDFNSSWLFLLTAFLLQRVLTYRFLFHYHGL